MAIQIPDNVRPAIDIFVKHHFWMLAAVVPLIVVPVAWMAAGDLSRKIAAKQGAIDMKLNTVRKVQGTPEHPNESWAEALEQDKTSVKRDTLAQWQRFYESQSFFRVWPDSLGPDFVERARLLKPGGRLSQPMLERYQDKVKNIVRTLPLRMGAVDAMRDLDAVEGSVRAGPGMPQDPRLGTQSKVRWNEADQKRLYESFDWQKKPTTAQVVLAQEEIWMYEILCDIVKEMNAKSAGAYDATIPYVDELCVGFPAAEERPGGAGEMRVMRVKSTPGMLMASPDGAPGAGPLPRPGHPRFANVGEGGFSARPGPAGDGEGGGGPASPDDVFRNWIYVGFDGKPLMASEQAAVLANSIVHLMPFRLRVAIDQRRIDELLVKLAGAKLPIDVRQVRINPGSGRARAQTGDSGQPGASGSSANAKLAAIGPPRPYDVILELRGSIAIAGQPDRKAVLGDLPEEEPGAAEGARENLPAEDAAAAPAEGGAASAVPASASETSVGERRRNVRVFEVPA